MEERSYLSGSFFDPVLPQSNRPLSVERETVAKLFVNSLHPRSSPLSTIILDSRYNTPYRESLQRSEVQPVINFHKFCVSPINKFTKTKQKTTLKFYIQILLIENVVEQSYGSGGGQSCSQ